MRGDLIRKSRDLETEKVFENPVKTLMANIFRDSFVAKNGGCEGEQTVCEEVLVLASVTATPDSIAIIPNSVSLERKDQISRVS